MMLYLIIVNKGINKSIKYCFWLLFIIYYPILASTGDIAYCLQAVKVGRHLLDEQWWMTRASESKRSSTPVDVFDINILG